MAITILVVEDDPHVRGIFESLLARDPALVPYAPRVVTAGDGEEGLALFDRERPQLVVSDLLMPRMDGFTMCRAIRDRAGPAEVALLVTSAVWTDAGIVERLREELEAEFFAKPFQVRELCATVVRVLGAREERRRMHLAAQAAAQVVHAAASEIPAAGHLGDRPLPRLLLDAHERRLSGTLSLRRGEVQKEVHLLLGHPVGVESNVRTETLGHILVGRGVLTPAQLDAALGRAREHGDKLGGVLVEMGLLSEHEVVRYLTAQVKVKLVNSLRWSDGDFRFQAAGEGAERGARSEIDPASLVFAGLKRTAQPPEVLERLRTRRDEVMGPTPRLKTYREPFRRVFGRAAVEALARRGLVGDLLEAAADPADLAAALEALVLAGMAEVEDLTASQLIRAGLRGGPAKLPADPATPPPEPAEPPDGAAPEPIADDGSGTLNLYDELFGAGGGGLEITPHSRGPDELPRPALNDSTEISLAGAAPAAPDAGLEALRRGLLAQYLRLGDADHYALLGAARDASRADLERAYAEVVARLGLERLAGRDLGTDYAKLEQVSEALRDARAVLTDPARRAAYDRGLAPPPGSAKDRKVEAELTFREGEAALRDGDLATARARFAAAVELDPGEADYQAHLGWSIYLGEGSGGASAAAAAEGALARALSIDPGHAAAHEFLGRIAEALGDPERAIYHLETALATDPGRAEALAAVEALLAPRDEPRRLERLFRRAITGLGDRELDLRVRLWWNLAELYRARIGDQRAAQAAFEEAARLAPAEPRLQEALAALYAPDPERYLDAVRALRAWWRLVPADPAPSRALFRLHRAAGRTDAALLAASALALRGALEPEVEGFLAQQRPRAPSPSPRPLNRVAREAVRHPDDDPLVGELFALLDAVAHEVHPIALSDLQLVDSDEVPVARRPAAFGRLLDRVAGALGVSPPPVYARPDLGAELELGLTSPRVLLCGPDALRVEDEAQLAFRLARSLSLLAPGRLLTQLPVKTLRALLLGASALSSPDAPIGDDPTGQIEAARALLSGASRQARAQLQAIVERLGQTRGSVNLSRWIRGVQRTSERIGFIFCNDLLTAARLCDRHTPGAQDALVDFALSPDYLALRDDLGQATR